MHGTVSKSYEDTTTEWRTYFLRGVMNAITMPTDNSKSQPLGETTTYTRSDCSFILATVKAQQRSSPLIYVNSS